MKNVRAKKSLGQHFLNDEHIASRIADTISARELPEHARAWGDLPILEIGPGMGILTKYLMDTRRPLQCVELDSESVGFLHKLYPDLNVVEADFLKMDLDTVFPGQDMALIGNFPYNISSQIFFKVLDHRDRIPVAAGMLQKEVAERICAAPGNRDRGILSVLLQAWYDCEYLFTVEPFVFTPPPKVRSAVIRMMRNSRAQLGCDEVLYKRLVKTVFNQRRKMLRGTLRGLLQQMNNERGLQIDHGELLSAPMLTRRPEQLSVEDFIVLTNQVAAAYA